MESQAAASPTFEPAYSVVIYDSKSGDVLQFHHFAAMPGVPLPDTERLHEMALRHAARRHGRAPTSMGLLRIQNSAIQRKRSYRVSLPDHRLVEAKDVDRK